MHRIENSVYEMELAGQRLFYNFYHENTVRWFEWHMKQVTSPLPCSSLSNQNSPRYDYRSKQLLSPDSPIFVPLEMIQLRLPEFDPDVPEDYVEYRVCVEVAGRALANKGCFIFHATAFFWRDLAWLLTAPSGTGKSTQFHIWKKLWPEEVSILCGDMPALSLDPHGTVWVHPSPWNGKEREGFENHYSAPLGGIVFLKQDDANYISEAPLSKLIRPLWHQFIGQADTALQIRNREHFLNQTLRHHPFWLLENRGDIASAQLTRRTFEEYLQRRQENGSV